MAEETLWNGVRIAVGDAFPLGTDSMVLADFARFSPDASIADLGCGSGALSLLLLGKYPRARLTGVELLAAPAALARENAARSGLSGRFSVVEGDLRQYRTLLPANRFDGVIANPPYYPEGGGRLPADEALAAARSEKSCSLAELCRCAAWALRFGGSFAVVHKPERLADLIWTLRLCRLEPKRLRFVRHRAGAGVSLVLLESRLGGGPGLQLCDDLILYRPDGSETEELRRIYHRQEGSA